MGGGPSASSQTSSNSTASNAAQEQYGTYLNNLPNPGSGQDERDNLLNQYSNFATTGGVSQQNANALTGIYGGPSYTAPGASTAPSSNNSASQLPYTTYATGPGGNTNVSGTSDGAGSAANPSQSQSSGGGGAAVVHGDPTSSQSIEDFINQNIETTQGRAATASDYAYWEPMIQAVGGVGDGQYWNEKMGTASGGASGGSSGGGAGVQTFAGLGPSAYEDVTAANSNYGIPSGPSAYQGVSLPTTSNFSNLDATSSANGVNIPAANSSAYSNVNLPDYSSLLSAYQNFAGQNGGVDPKVLEQLQNAEGQLSNENIDPASYNGLLGLAANGGYSADDINSVDRDSLTGIESNGGYSASDLANIRSQAAAAAPALFNNLQQGLNNYRTVTGNIAGAGATDFASARAAAQQQSQDRVNAEIGINQAVTGNKLTAGTTLANLNNTMLANRNQTSLNAYTNAGNLNLNTAAENRQGLVAASDLGLQGQQLVTGNQLAGLSGQLNTGQATASNSLAQAGGEDQFTNAQTAAALQKAGLLDTYGLQRASGLDASQVANANLALNQAGGEDAYTNNIAGLGLNQSEFNAGQNNSVALARAGGIDQNTQAGASIGLGYAGLAQQYGLAQQAGQLQTGMYLNSAGQQGQEYGTTGAANLYGTSYGPSNAYNSAYLGGLNGQTSAGLGYAGLNNQNVNKPGVGSQIASGLAGGAGAYNDMVNRNNQTPGESNGSYVTPDGQYINPNGVQGGTGYDPNDPLQNGSGYDGSGYSDVGGSNVPYDGGYDDDNPEYGS